jgi:hypothetical protein
MFRKLQDRVVAAASNALGISATNQSDNIQRLQALGDYSVGEVEAALDATSGNVDRAAELLLSQQRAAPVTANGNVMNTTHFDANDEDMELQQALQQSLELNEQRTSNTRPTSQQANRTDVMNQAAEAALRRAESSNKTNRKNVANKRKVPNATTVHSTNSNNESTAPKKSVIPKRPIRTKSELLRQYHPDVKLVPKLQDKTIEEQVLRTVDRMKNYPAAVDTLYRAISMIYNNPNDNMKYRRIDTSTPGYQRSVAGVPGTQDFLRVMKFHNERYDNTSPILILSEPMYDPGLIYLGLSALEQIKLTPEYIVSKKQHVFIKDVTSLIDESTLTAEEIQQRNQYQLKCPKEPAEGRGALLQIHITDTYTIRRRFDSDDTILDVLHWIASTVGTTMFNRIVNNTYCLIDMNHTQRIPIIVTGPAIHYTLQYVGCWPSGRIQLQPSSLFEADVGGDTTTTKIMQQQEQQWNNKIGLPRSLASGASSTDDE